MELEIIQERFKTALAEFSQEFLKLGYSQKAIICNDYGVFINFAGAEVNYSHYSLDDNLEHYLKQQEGAHTSFLRVLLEHKLHTKRNLKRSNSSIYTFLQGLAKPSKEDLEKTIQQGVAKVAFDRTLMEGALLGKYFFEEFVVDYTKNRHDEIQKRIVAMTDNIYLNLTEIKSMDTALLEYLRNRELVWYAKS